MAESPAVCPVCSTDTGRNFCSKCRRRLHCPKCKAFTRADFKFCEECGETLTRLEVPANSLASSTGDNNTGNLTAPVSGQIPLDRSVHIGGDCGNVVTGDNNTVTMTTTFSRIRIKNQDEISQELEKWTKGMVETAAFRQVKAMLDEGTTWITVKGSPGEGKTTVAKMALRYLQTESGRQVFQVRSPKEFTEVARTCSCPVIMLDDILGNLELDQTAWLRWKDVFHEILDVKEHRSHEQKTETSETDCPTVILAGRDYVLNAVSVSMGRLYDVIVKPSNVVDMSHSVVREIDEKEKIWDAIVGPSGIKVSRDEINDIFNLQGGHGFPHVCRLFVIMYKEMPRISPRKYFKTPLKFLNETIGMFLEDDKKLLLFKEMVVRHGVISERDLQNNPEKLTKVARELLGTYLRMEDGCFVFDHPSIYDSVAFNLCKLHTLFVIENCHLTFLHERLRLQPSLDTVRGSDRGETDLVVHISHCFLEDLAKRFADELSKGNLLLVLSHQACAQEMFIKEMMSQLTIPLHELVNMKDRSSREHSPLYVRNLDTHFLTLVASNKSPHLMKFMDQNTNVKCYTTNLSVSEIVPFDSPFHAEPDLYMGMDLVLYGVCKYAASDILTYLRNRGHTINVEFQFAGNKTPLMVAAETGDSQFVHQILSLNPDLSVRDCEGRTALHYMCDSGLVTAVRQIIDRCDVNMADKYDFSPLTYACKSNHSEMADLLLSSGARDDNNEAVSMACRNGNIDILNKLLESGVSLNRRSLCVACEGGHVKMISYLIQRGCPVNYDGYITPLYSACCYNKPQAVQCLLEHGAVITSNVLYRKEHVDVLLKAGVDVNAQDEEGQTPLHKAVSYRGYDRFFLPDITVCQTLITQGTDINRQDQAGNTPLHLLCRVDSGTKIYKIGFRSFQLATSYEDEYRSLVKLFVDSGASITILNNTGEPALRGWCQTLYTSEQQKSLD